MSIRDRLEGIAVVTVLALTFLGVGMAGKASASELERTTVAGVPVTLCHWEDAGQSCRWDARVQGNGHGQSFYRDASGRVHYLSNRRAFRVRMLARDFRPFHAIQGHQLCFVRVGATSVVRCFGGFRATS